MPPIHSNAYMSNLPKCTRTVRHQLPPPHPPLTQHRVVTHHRFVKKLCQCDSSMTAPRPGCVLGRCTSSATAAASEPLAPPASVVEAHDLLLGGDFTYQKKRYNIV